MKQDYLALESGMTLFKFLILVFANWCSHSMHKVNITGAYSIHVCLFVTMEGKCLMQRKMVSV